jgi:hypothetical protein
MNPASGREQQWGKGKLVKNGQSRVVVVAGAGPAGMRAASLLGQRGFDVHLIERQAEPGGHLRQLAQLPHCKGWQAALEHLEQGIDRENIQLSTGITLTAERVLEIHPYAVVCATGSTWDRSGWTPAQLDERHDTPPKLVMDIGMAIDIAVVKPGALGKRIIIVDATGDYLPVGLADLLSEYGAQVEIVSHRESVGELLTGTLDASMVFPRLARRSVRLTAQSELTAIGAKGVSGRSIWGGSVWKRSAIDRVIFSLYRTASTCLYEALCQQDTARVIRIGDALAPRRTADAIYDGERTGRLLGQDEIST